MNKRTSYCNTENYRNSKIKSSGITLIALVITIIVLLILAGISLNAIVGDNGILSKVNLASLKQKVSNYEEEFEMNKVAAMIKNGIYDELCLNLLGTDEAFLDYVPSIKDLDKTNYEIIGGYLVYIGDDEKENEVAQSIGLYSKNDQVLYDVVGREFKIYCDNVEEAKASGKISASVQNLTTASFEQINAGLDNKIPDKYKNLFILSNGILTYTGTDEDRLILLSTSSTLAEYIRPASGNSKLILQNYVSPVSGTIVSTSFVNGKTVYKISTNDKYWTVRIDSSNGNISYATITRYEGVGGTITIPDVLNLENGNIIKVLAVEGKGNGSGNSRNFAHNIFQDDNGNSTTTSTVTQVIVAKGIYQIKDYALAYIGDNRPFQILHDGSDLNLDNGTGIEGSCGSYTFTAATTSTYTLKCWGASGAGWNKITAETNNWGSTAGYGGYSEGTINLRAGEKLYVNIGGKGLSAFEIIEDTSIGTSNGSGGYNGGGNIKYNSSTANNAGGGCTDIRYGGSSAESQILVAGGGGGVDDYASSNGSPYSQGTWGRNIEYAYNDGSGGYGGGTVSATDKSTWSGGYGYNNGLIDLEKKYPEYTYNYTSWDVGYGCPGLWTFNGIEYIAKGYARLMGADIELNTTSSNSGAGGGGYYGGTYSRHLEGGGGGGSAYANTDLLTAIRGYSDHEAVTRSDDGSIVQGSMLASEIPTVTYYGRSMPALTYGNGLVAIEK